VVWCGVVGLPVINYSNDISKYIIVYYIFIIYFISREMRYGCLGEGRDGRGWEGRGGELRSTL
jgi:hypothetical protein